MAARDLLGLVTQEYRGNIFIFETVRRRRVEWQAAGFWPPCDEVLIERRAKERVYHDEFSRSSEGSS